MDPVKNNTPQTSSCPMMMSVEAISEDEFFGDYPDNSNDAAFTFTGILAEMNQRLCQASHSQLGVDCKKESRRPGPTQTKDPLDAEDISEDEFGVISQPSPFESNNDRAQGPQPPTYEESKGQLPPPPPEDETQSLEVPIQDRDEESELLNSNGDEEDEGNNDEESEMDEEPNFQEDGEDPVPYVDSSGIQYDMSSDSDGDAGGEEMDDPEVGEEEIDNLLEQGLPKDYQRPSKPAFIVKQLFILEEKGKNSLEALPQDWLEIRHSTGIPVYLHRTSRVCTLAKPYSLGPSSVRKHLLPLSGIPCLSYRRALEKEAKEANVSAETEMKLDRGDGGPPAKRLKEDGPLPSSSPPTFVPLPAAKVETAEETNTLFTVQPEEMREYCQRLFRFKTIECRRFKNWTAKRKHTKMQKRLKVQRPSLPDGVKLIKFPVKPLGNGDGNGRGCREYVLNPKGKSSVCILHEYVQHALRQQPVYKFKELEHASTPYSATVLINNIQYGTGFGTSKKQAKSNAAKETLEVLIPQIKDTLSPPEKKVTKQPSTEAGYTECFGEMSLDDKRIAGLCQSISEPTPYSLLLTCIQRNYGKMSDGGLQFEMVSTLPNQKIKFKMSFKDHIVEIVASNKKEGKQVASQTMLAKIHPHIENFGAFIRLYGNDSIKSCKEKKQDQQEVTELQSKASVNSPNFAILAKLREEMQKLYKDEAAMEKESKIFEGGYEVSRITRERIYVSNLESHDKGTNTEN